MQIKIRRLIWCLAATLFVLQAHSQGSVSLYVGGRQLVSAPNPPSGAALSQTAWASRHSSVSVEKVGNAAYIKVNSYFTGTAQVQCDYYYYWYDNYGYMHTNHATTYYNVTCKAVNINLTTSSMSLAVGEGGYIKYSLSPTISPTPTVRFSSSNTYVATVNDDGYVRGVGSGSTTITLMNSAGPNATVYVTVKSVDPTSVSIPSSLTAYVGETSSLSATLYPSNAQATLSWYSANSNIASVSSSGVVTGKAEGSTVIYVKTSKGLYSNDCNVTVKYRKPSSVSLSSSTLYVPIGQSKSLTASVSPSNAKYTLTWSSSNENVASVSSSGVVTAKKAGSATITVRTDNGYSATCRVTVPPMPESVSTSSKVSIPYKGTRKLQAQVLPTDAYVSLSWSSDDASVAWVDANGKVTAVGVGATDVTVTTSNGIKATCRVEVTKPDYNFIVWTHDGEKITFSLDNHPVVTRSDEQLVVTTANTIVEYPSEQVHKFTMEDNTVEALPASIVLPEAITLAYKEQTTLEYTLLPEDYDIETTLTWSSDNAEVARVDNHGTVTACGAGEATITVKARNGRSASCRVEVPVPHYYLVVWMHEGGYVTYPLDEHPIITYADEQILVSTPWNSVTYSHAQVRKFTLTDTDTPQDDTPKDDDTVISSIGSDLRNQGDAIVFSACTPGEHVGVYDASGRLLHSYAIGADGNLTLSLSAYGRGVYVVKMKSITYKFIKK